MSLVTDELVTINCIDGFITVDKSILKESPVLNLILEETKTNKLTLLDITKKLLKINMM